MKIMKSSNKEKIKENDNKIIFITGTPGTTVPGTPEVPGEVPEPGYGIREIPSVGFWVHNDPLVLD